MLKIWLGDFQKGCIVNPDRYFNMHKESKWFDRQDIKDIIMGIENIDRVDGEYLHHRIFGGMSPERLSSGVKCLILLTINPLCNVYASRCGDNCAKYILDLAEKTDVVITLHHGMIFPRDFDGMIMDTGERFSSKSAFVKAYIKFRYS